MTIADRLKVFKDDKGKYYAFISGDERQQDGTNEKFYVRVPVYFRNGVEVKNKTTIDVKSGFIKMFRIDDGETFENGKTKYRYYPRITILDFDIIEDGIDEVQQTRNYSNNNQTNYENNSVGAFYPSGDDLPF